jgi:hypothetical protein
MHSSKFRRTLPFLIALVLASCFALGACGGSSHGDSTTPDLEAGTEQDSGTSASDASLTANDAEPSSDAAPATNDAEAGPSCSLPIAGTLNLPTSTIMGTLRGPSRNMTTSCTPDQGTQGPEALYLLNVAQRTGVILRTEATTNTVLAIRRVCDDPVTEVGCNNDGPMPPNANLRAILDPGTYYVLVDVYAFGIGGDFTLSLETFTPPSNGTCASAAPVSDGAKVQGDLINAAVPPRAITCPSTPPVPSGVLYYKATIPAGNRLVASARGPMGEGYIVEVLDSCTSSSCRSSGFSQVTETNDGAAARDVILTVSSSLPAIPPNPGGKPPLPGGPGTNTTFELDVSIQPLASNATCAGAKAVSAGMMVTGDTSYGGKDFMNTCTGGPFPPGLNISSPLWYSVAVPAGQVMRVNVTTTDPFTPFVGAVDGCGANAMCLGPSGGPPAPGPGSVLRYANGGATTKNVLFYVGHPPFSSAGRFSLTVSIDPLAANGICSTPTALTDGVAVQGDTTIGSTGSVPCLGSSPGLLYYSMTVPAAKTLVVGLKPTLPSDMRVAILDSCSATSCLNTPDPGPVPTATYTNSTGSPRPVIVAVSAGFSGGGGFSMTASLRDPPTNMACAAATPVTNGTTLTFQDATAGSDNLSSRCLPSDTGGVLYYSATIGAGQTLKATATSSGKWLASLRVLASCGASTCLASSNMPIMFPQNAVVYTNNGGSPLDVILAVGPMGMFGGPAGYFDLDIAITGGAAVDGGM